MNTLLAVDGSDHSYEAVRALKHLRRADQLTLLHVVDAPRPAYPMMVPEVAQELYAQLERSMKEDGEQLLTRIQSLLPLHSGPVTKLLHVGSPAEHIVAAAQSCHADLIVMGARGLGPVKERLLGSVSHRVLSMAPLRQIDSPRVTPRVEAGPPPSAGAIRRRGGATLSRQTAISRTGQPESPGCTPAHTSTLAGRRFRCGETGGASAASCPGIHRGRGGDPSHAGLFNSQRKCARHSTHHDSA